MLSPLYWTVYGNPVVDLGHIYRYLATFGAIEAISLKTESGGMRAGSVYYASSRSIAKAIKKKFHKFRLQRAYLDTSHDEFVSRIRAKGANELSGHYEVQRIAGHRLRHDGSVEYKVEWKGWASNCAEWVKLHDLVSSL